MNVSLGMVNPVQISSTAHGHNSKVTLPVARGDSYYAHFKYVQGFPASHQQNSVPIKRLELLNNMIVSLQRLNSMASQNRENLIKPGSENISPSDTDLEKIGSLIHDTLSKMPPSFAPADASSVTTGLAFSFQA